MFMKTKNIILYTVSAFLLIALGCTNKLTEHPFTVFSTDYFKTPDGFRSGVYALYSNMRYLSGTDGMLLSTVGGTDEYTYADQVRVSSGGDAYTAGNYTLDANNGGTQTAWGRSWPNINQANMLIQFAPSVIFSPTAAIDSSTRNVLIAETRFLRAHYYMILVLQYGAVPVDLGSGDLAYNATPFQGFNRLPFNDILKKDYSAIINDLIYATQQLPDQRPAGAFKLFKAAAFHLLAKAYIQKAYSTAKEATDFTNAYNAAIEVINNQSKYGVALQPAYALVHAQGNDYNSEMLYSVERIPGNNSANELPDPTNTIGGTKGVDANNDFNMNYTLVFSPLATSTTNPTSVRNTAYGRPLRRWCPTPWNFNTAFADKDNDSRYDGTFQTVYLATTATGTFAVGDTAFILTKTNQEADSINGLPVKKKYRVVAPREFYSLNGYVATQRGEFIFPALSKYFDAKKNQPNDQGGRPFPMSKLSEVYLLGAEAALQDGHPADAVTLINALRLRAANRKNLSPNQIKDIIRKSPLGAAAINGTNLSDAEVQRRYNAIQITDVSQITLDFILDERTRELCGEQMRWSDLATRGKLVDRVKAFNTDAAPNIQNFHALRPIPRSQLNAVSDLNTSQYQNPGY